MPGLCLFQASGDNPFGAMTKAYCHTESVQVCMYTDLSGQYQEQVSLTNYSSTEISIIKD